MSDATTRTASTPDGAIDRSQAQRIATLFDEHHERLFAIALRLVGERQEALDLMQETFLRAIHHASRIPEDPPAARAWLARTTLNLTRDRWRRHGVRDRFLHDARATARARTPGDQQPAARLAVQQALEQLSPRQRAIVLMAEVEGMNGSEIARELGLAAVTVRWHLSMARRRLRQRLGVHATPCADREGG